MFNLCLFSVAFTTILCLFDVTLSLTYVSSFLPNYLAFSLCFFRFLFSFCFSYCISFSFLVANLVIISCYFLFHFCHPEHRFIYAALCSFRVISFDSVSCSFMPFYVIFMSHCHRKFAFYRYLQCILDALILLLHLLLLHFLHALLICISMLPLLLAVPSASTSANHNECRSFIYRSLMLILLVVYVLLFNEGIQHPYIRPMPSALYPTTFRPPFPLPLASHPPTLQCAVRLHHNEH